MDNDTKTLTADLNNRVCHCALCKLPIPNKNTIVDFCSTECRECFDLSVAIAKVKRELNTSYKE